MFGRKKPAPEVVVHMPYEEELMALEPGQDFILFWKGRPLYIRPATVTDIEKSVERGRVGKT